VGAVRTRSTLGGGAGSGIPAGGGGRLFDGAPGLADRRVDSRRIVFGTAISWRARWRNSAHTESGSPSASR
jgi:hypothetical protein